MRPNRRAVSGRINFLVLLGCIAIGGAAAYFYMTRGGDKSKDQLLKDAGKLIEQAGQDVKKSAADEAADLERRNQSIQHKRGFDIAK